MDKASGNTAVSNIEAAEWSTFYLGRLTRCLRLSNAWQLYLTHNAQLGRLLQHVTELSYRDCVQHGLKIQADRLLQAQI
jgi:hypothetical protein